MAKIHKSGRFIGARGIGGNSVSVVDGDFVTKSGGYMIKTIAGGSVEGITAGDQSFAADNQTVDIKKLEYIEADDYSEYDIEAVGATLVFAGDLITSNVINMKVNGVAISPITFDTLHLTTMGLIETELETFAEILSVTVGGTGNRTLTIVPAVKNSQIAITDIVVTLGATQTTGVYSEQSLAIADEGKFYDVTTGDQYIDIATAHATSGQFKLVKARVGSNRGVFTVANT